MFLPRHRGTSPSGLRATSPGSGGGQKLGVRARQRVVARREPLLREVPEAQPFIQCPSGRRGAVKTTRSTTEMPLLYLLSPAKSLAIPARPLVGRAQPSRQVRPVRPASPTPHPGARRLASPVQLSLPWAA